MHHVLKSFHDKYPEERLFRDTTQEFVDSIEGHIDPVILSLLLHAERIITFRVPWFDDHGNTHVNYGYRVQHSSVLGPYKGGIRFHPSVNLDVLKFLAFEQTFKNALTGLPLGGAKGGSDFDPKGKSDREIMTFCQSFMNELYRHIGPNTDVPAGDLGVGNREIGYMFGQYKRLTNRYEGVFTGKNPLIGGALGRSEATGFGLIYIVSNLLSDLDQSIKGKRVVISGSGKVGAYAALKAQELGAVVIAMNDSKSTIVNESGLDTQAILHAKLNEDMSLEEYALNQNMDVYPQKHIWSLSCDIALPCATQNEMNLEDMQSLLAGGCTLIAEGANMPLSMPAYNLLRSMQNKVHYLPGKAANAGGVATSGIEMIQNAQKDVFTFETVDERLKEIMKSLYTSIKETADFAGKPYDFVFGANLLAYKRLEEAIRIQGII